MSDAEIRTALVDTFTLKGFTEPVAVYRIEQRHRTQVISDQYIVLTDLHGFGKFSKAVQVARVEKVLDRLLELIDQVCRQFGGTKRFNAGDAYCLTFLEVAAAISATESVSKQWDLFCRHERLDCPILAVIHKGKLTLFRSYLFSDDVSIVSEIMTAIQRDQPGSANLVFITGRVQQELQSTRFQITNLGERDHNKLAGIEIFRLGDGDAV